MNNSNTCLGQMTEIKLTENNVFLKDFFRTREGLVLTEDFEGLVSWVQSKMLDWKEESFLSYVDLTRDARNSEIAHGLPKGFIFESGIETFLTNLATLIEGQPNGQKGPLLSSYHGRNIFYVYVQGIVWIAIVSWDEWRYNTKGWHCHFVNPDNIKYYWASSWSRPTRVFSAHKLT